MKKWNLPDRFTAFWQEKFGIIPSEADETLEVTLATPEEADIAADRTRLTSALE